MNTQSGLFFAEFAGFQIQFGHLYFPLVVEAVKNVPSSGQAIRKTKILIKLKDTNLCTESGKIVPQIDIYGRKSVGLPLFDIDF